MLKCVQNQWLFTRPLLLLCTHSFSACSRSPSLYLCAWIPWLFSVNTQSAQSLTLACNRWASLIAQYNVQQHTITTTTRMKIILNSRTKSTTTMMSARLIISNSQFFLICAGSFTLIAFYRNCKHSRPIDFSNDRRLRLRYSECSLVCRRWTIVCAARNVITFCFSFIKNEMKTFFSNESKVRKFICVGMTWNKPLKL